MLTNEELLKLDAGTLRGMVAGLQEDAERYRWLRNTSTICAPRTGMGGIALPKYETSQSERIKLDAHLDRLRSLPDIHIEEQIREALNQ